ncbi:hypothetical protein BJY00DRAFT_316089 [Aspergillus carlsbadensis]|nr:hypothetical protein BJY00DRAFT_316089 [Aspergillus carlsbadensis]
MASPLAQACTRSTFNPSITGMAASKLSAAAAGPACDDLDGVKDGIVARVDTCLDVLDPFSMVGKTVKCADKNGTEVRISKAAAIVAAATCHKTADIHGKPLYCGIAPGSNLASSFASIATAKCTGYGCIGSPQGLGLQWLQLLTAKDLDKDLTKVCLDDYDRLARFASQQYKSIMDTSDPELTSFRDSRGKLITYHGLVSRRESYPVEKAELLPPFWCDVRLTGS